MKWILVFKMLNENNFNKIFMFYTQLNYPLISGQYNHVLMRTRSENTFYPNTPSVKTFLEEHQ